uniref:Reelin domain-containing protein n=1 Tax=Biomphalaria glabrata TaxID=6526 RepID=A0A2C9LHA0_BIOGL
MLLITFYLFLMCMSIVICYPDGLNVDTACNTMVPNHGTSAQSSQSPYKIQLASSSYTPGVPVSVTIYSTSAQFKGFMIQARKADGTQSDGYFTVITGTIQACSNKALVQSNSNAKASLTFNWNPPSTAVGDITFKATFVQSKTVFWTNTEIVVLKPVAVITTISTASTISSSTTISTTTKSSGTHNTTQGPLGPITLDAECGKTRGCFSLCAHGGCKFFVSWYEENLRAHYILKSVVSYSSGSFMALGLSSDKRMGEDAIIGCYHGSSGSNIKFSATSTDRVMPNIFVDTDLVMTSSSYTGGVLTCFLNRPVSATLKLYDVSKQWTLFFATGSASYTSNVLQLKYHGTSRYMSESSYSITSTANVQAMTAEEEKSLSHGRQNKYSILTNFIIVILVVKYFTFNN